MSLIKFTAMNQPLVHHGFVRYLCHGFLYKNGELYD